MEGLENHVKKMLVNSEWGLARKKALDPKYDWDFTEANTMSEIKQTHDKRIMDEITKAINQDYYNTLNKLFDGDFMTKLDYPNKITDQWNYVTVGMMMALYNSMEE